MCVCQRIYDQSSFQNHLGIEHGARNLRPPRNAQDFGVNLTDPASKATLGGKATYGAVFAGNAKQDRQFVGQGYVGKPCCPPLSLSLPRCPAPAFPRTPAALPTAPRPRD